MKNFWTLFGYEMKKIWKRKLAWEIIALAAGFCVYMELTSLGSSHAGATFTFVDKNGIEISQYLSAREQNERTLEGSRLLDGQVMDEDFFRDMRESIPSAETYYELESYFLLIDPRYRDYCYFRGAWPQTADEFYDLVQEIDELSLEKLSGREQAYWAARATRIERPYVYRDITGVRRIVELMGNSGVPALLPLLVGVCLCGLFSQECHSRMDALIFSTGRGRFPLYLAKTLAGAFSALAVTALAAGAAIGANLLVYGVWGFDGAIQMFAWLNSTLWPITMGQAVVILLLLALAYALVCCGVTALVSVWSGSSVAALTASVGLLFLALWSRGAAVRFGDYLPGQLVDYTVFLNTDLTSVFGVQLNQVQSGFLLYLLIAVILFALCWLGWRRSAAGRA